MNALPAGTSAPDFTLPTIDGHTVALHDALKKGPVVLAFFKISCPVCQYAFPLLERLYQANKSAKVTFLGVSQDNAQDTQAFLREFGVTFPVALDEPKHYQVSNAYGLTNVPTVFYIAPNGEIEVSSVSWSKADIEAIHQKFSETRRQPAAPLWRKGEDIRDFRAG